MEDQDVESTAAISLQEARFFISSTFADMHQERDALIREVFPKIRQALRLRGIEITDIDLRWGITREQAENGDILPICFAEIERCRPFFLGLLGNRYGTVVEIPESISDGHPSLSGIKECSITECEFLHGPLGPDGESFHTLVFEDGTPKADMSDGPDGMTESKELLDRQADLKRRIKAERIKVIEYSNLEEFKERAEEHITQLLNDAFPADDSLDVFAQEVREHDSFALGFCDTYLDYAGNLALLDEWLWDESSRILLVCGDEGAGKTALVANFLRGKSIDRHVTRFEHYCEAANNRASRQEIIRRLREWCRRVVGDSTYEILAGEFAGRGDFTDQFVKRFVSLAHDQDVSDGVTTEVFLGGKKEAVAGLYGRLKSAADHAASQGQRILIAIDGLEAEGSEADLSWLSKIIPDNVKVLLSSSAREIEQEITYQGGQQIVLEPLVESSAKALVMAKLGKWGRSLSEERLARILQNPLSSRPGYISVLLDQLRAYSTEALLDEHLDDLGAARSMPDLMQCVLSRVEQQCGADSMKRSLSLILCSRVGVEESDLVHLSGGTPLNWARTRLSLGHGVRESRGRIIIPDGALRRAAEARYFKMDSERFLWHNVLAEHLEQQPFGERQAEELPFQLRGAMANERLFELLTNLDNFPKLVAVGTESLLGYWSFLGIGTERMARTLSEAFADRASSESMTEEDRSIGKAILKFLNSVGASGASYLKISESMAHQISAGDQDDSGFDLEQLDHLANARSANGDHDGAEKILHKILEARLERLGPSAQATIATRGNLAAVVHNMGDITRAAELYQEALAAITDETSNAASVEHRILDNFGELLRDAGALKPAADAVGRSLHLKKQTLGVGSLETKKTAVKLGALWRDCAEYSKAKELLSSVLERFRLDHGTEHPGTLSCTRELILCLGQMGDVSTASSMLEELVGLTDTIDDTGDAEMNSFLLETGRMVYNMGDLGAARRLEERVAVSRDRWLGESHPATLLAYDNLACTLSSLGEYDRARSIFDRVIEGRREVLGSTHLQTIQSTENLAQCLIESGDLESARELAVSALDLREKTIGVENTETLICMLSLARLEGNLHRWSEAQVIQKRVLEIVEREQLEGHVVHGLALKSLSESATALDDPEAAEAFKIRFNTWRSRSEPR